MFCNTCNRNDAWAVRTRFGKEGMEDWCNFCGYEAHTGIATADVYFPRPHTCDNITDEAGKPIYFESRSHKARVMKEKGIQEAGDKISGARALPTLRAKSWYQMCKQAGKLK